MTVYVEDKLCELYSKLITQGVEEYTSQDGLIMDIWYEGALYRIQAIESDGTIYVESIDRIKKGE